MKDTRSLNSQQFQNLRKLLNHTAGNTAHSVIEIVYLLAGARAGLRGPTGGPVGIRRALLTAGG